MKGKVYFLGLIFVFAVGLFSQTGDVVVEYKNPVKVIGKEENNDFIFHRISYVKYNQYNKKIYTVDFLGNKIFVFDENLDFISEFGRKGQGPNEFLFPNHIGFDKTGDITVTDSRNHRIQILDKNYEYKSSFLIQQIASTLTAVAECDSKGKIYMNLTYGGKLMTVYNKKGNILKEFGKLVKENENTLYQCLENKVLVAIDEDDNVYCAFVNFPLLRKYDGKYNLLYEKNLSYLLEIKQADEKWKTEYEEKKGKFIYVGKNYVNGISYDEDFLYVGFNGKNSNPVYVFDKDTGNIVKKIVLQYKKDSKFGSFEFNLKNHFLAVEKSNMVLAKFEK